MKLTSLLVGVDVVLREFDWNDDSHIAENAWWHLHYGVTFERLGRYQMELRQSSQSGSFLIPKDTRVYTEDDDLVLFEDAGGVKRLRSFVHPVLTISSPSANANLDQPRLGQPVTVLVNINLGDLGKIIPVRDYLSDGQVLSDEALAHYVPMFIVVKQRGYLDVEMNATLDHAIDNEIQAVFKADLLIAHSGPTQLVGEFRSSSVSKRLSTAAVPVTVLPTAQRSFEITIDGRAGPGVDIASPVSAAKTVEVALYAAASGFLSSGITIESSLDRFQSRNTATPQADETRHSQLVHKWTTATTPLLIGPNRPPGLHSLRITDVDAFGVETLSSFNFSITDNTPPTIDIIEPHEHAVLLDRTGSPNPPMLVFRGTFRDSQSGGAQSLKYSFGGVSDVPVPPDGIVNDSWTFQVPFPPVGPHELTMTATDAAGNTAPRLAVRQFEVVYSYKPKSIDELLGPTAYLNELLRFTGSHLLKENSPVDAALVLVPAFKQPFNEIAQPDVPANERLVSDLLTPVRILRNVNAADADAADTAGLIARWTFAELAQGAPDGMRDRAGRFGLPGNYRGIGTYDQIVDRMWGRPGTDMEEAVVLDGNSYVEVGHYAVLEVGKDNRDFSVSFWIYPSDTGNGTWRQVLYKGEDRVVNEVDGSVDVEGNRTFGIWLHERSNRVHFRISTITPAISTPPSFGLGFPFPTITPIPFPTITPIQWPSNWNLGGDSETSLVVNRWSHLAYVKFGRVLKLYINGQLDTEVELPTNVISNSKSLYIGKSPYFDSFRGGLAELRLYGFALGSADVEQLALDRRHGLTETPIADYHEAAYEAVLIGLGTSLEELRGLGTLSDVQRRALAERLGLLNVGSTGDALDSLIPNVLPGTEMFELWLAGFFGLPLTFTPQNSWDVPSSIAQVVWYRRVSLSYQWAVEDAQQARFPELDPDLIDSADLSSSAEDWVRLLRVRRAELAVQFEAFDALLVRAGSIASALSQVYSRDELGKLQDLANTEMAGLPIAQELPRFNLDRKMFRRLLAYMGTLNSAVLTAHEREDFSHLLTQLWKVRTRYAAWKQEETALNSRLWPTPSAEAAWVPGSYKRDFQPWRGNAQQRADIEARMANRLRAWQSISDGQEQAVAEAQRIALPLLRDNLLGIGDLPSACDRMDNLTERWLVDFAATSATFVTPVEQATLSVQTLINGIRNSWYEANHVAFGWTIKPEYRDAFDAEWQWLGTYGNWRAAVLSYLYSESTLFPDLRKEKSDLNPQGSTAEFITFLGELRKLQPITSTSLNPLPPTALSAAQIALGTNNDESDYYAPMAIGLALQRAGLYSAALDEYRKVYDPSVSGAARKKVAWLMNENDSQPPAPSFDDRWTLALTDPHAVALLTYLEGTNVKRVWGNPYTRYTLIQIVHCLLAQADGEFAAGTRDSRAKALSLYLEAKEVLAFDELRDLQPLRPEQVYLPNPVLAAQRAHVDVALRKIRRGLSFLGTPLPPDLTRGPNAGAVSSLVRPTPYRFKVLMERAKQLAAQAQQFESQYLSVIEKGEAATEQLMRENFVSEIAGQTVTLRQLGETEANTGKAIAELQRTRSQIQADRYQGWLSAGPNENERSQVEAIEQASTSRQIINVADSVIAVAQASQSTADLFKTVGSAGASVGFGIAMGAGITTKAIAQGFLIDQETRSQLSGILASQERRAKEWQLQRDLSRQDVLIGNKQVTAADDRVAIAVQESVIARTQLDQAQQMLVFLTNKFTSAEFYQWLTGVLSEVYAFFLRTAASNAQQAELQLAFERQEVPARLIKPDYWLAASQASSGNSDSAPDRRGISGSARLLQDLYTLDQQAFSSERRLLNLAQSFPLSRLMPMEFEEFRRTGLLTFSTPMQWFDEGFPGHYMRLIKRARISVAALIPPSRGIRATLTNGGLSRVVTADPGYPTVVVRQDPQSVALTSPVSATGVFELDTQSDLLFPFEGTGVDTTWFLELPPAGNPFDFDTLAEVVLTLEYSALMSYELRDRVIKGLPRRWSGDLSFSVRKDLPDVWYELSNPSQEGIPEIELVLDARGFPAGISNYSIDEVALSMRLLDRANPMVTVLPTFIPSGGTTPVVGAQCALVKGLVSSSQSGASSWGALRGSAGTAAGWKFQLADDPISDFSLREAFQESNVDDITIVFTVSGVRPAWAV